MPITMSATSRMITRITRYSVDDCAFMLIVLTLSHIFLNCYVLFFLLVSNVYDSGGNEMKRCNSCGTMEKNFVMFPCPNCGNVIYRCAKCRESKNKYVCEKCGFEGP